MSFRILLEPHGGEGGSSTSEESKGGTADPTAAFQKLLDKHSSDGVALARQLWEENKDYRQKNSGLKEKLPPTGSIVLSADEAKAWEAYRAVGKPEEIRKLKTEHTSLSDENHGFKREKEVAEFGKKAGVPTERLAALAKLITPGLSFAIQKVKDKAKGEDVDSVFVKDGDGEPVAFDTHFAEFLSVLKPDAKAKVEPQGTPMRRDRFQRPISTTGQRQVPRQLDPENPDDIKESIRASGLASF